MGVDERRGGESNTSYYIDDVDVMILENCQITMVIFNLLVSNSIQYSTVP